MNLKDTLTAMDNFDRDLEDLLNMTDTDDSSSSDGGVFESNHPYILELHDLQKDVPGTETVTQTQEPQKKKKEKRKKRKSQQDSEGGEASDTSSSLSDSVPTVPDETTREEFYDAHESYHAMPDNQPASPTAALVLAQVHSQNNQEPKSDQERTISLTPSATPRDPSIINKPVSNPP